VTDKDPAKNVVFVSRNYHRTAYRRDKFKCGRFSWNVPTENGKATNPAIADLTR
jgi:hypothetical protein